MLVLFEIYIEKIIKRIESWFWLFNEGMNRIIDMHIFVWQVPYNTVHVGYSIHTFIKRPKSTFNS